MKVLVMKQSQDLVVVLQKDPYVVGRKSYDYRVRE